MPLTYTQRKLNDISISSSSDGNFRVDSAPPSLGADDMASSEIRDVSTPFAGKDYSPSDFGKSGNAFSIIDLINKNAWFINQIYKDYRYGEMYQSDSEMVNSIINQHFTGGGDLTTIEIKYYYASGELVGIDLEDINQHKLISGFSSENWKRPNPDYIQQYNVKTDYSQVYKAIEDINSAVENRRRGGGGHNKPDFGGINVVNVGAGGGGRVGGGGNVIDFSNEPIVITVGGSGKKSEKPPEQLK